MKAYIYISGQIQTNALLKITFGQIETKYADLKETPVANYTIEYESKHKAQQAIFEVSQMLALKDYTVTHTENQLIVNCSTARII